MMRWEDAWADALYGAEGFYRRPEGPAGHFRTAAHAAPDELADAMAKLARQHGASAVVDVGAGRGELVTALGRRSRDLRLAGVDVVPRPPALPTAIGWAQGLAELPDGALTGALVTAWELLDVVPCPVLELDPDGVLRHVLVDPATGRESLGEPGTEDELRWIERWWPLDDAGEGDRVEVGASRDLVWSALVERARAAGAVAVLAVDYGHDLEHRPAEGSLTGFREGRAVPPRPDGSMDVTAHVAVDSVAAAGLAAGATSSTLTSQHTGLSALGVRRSELLDVGGLGGFRWLLQLLLGGVQ